MSRLPIVLSVMLHMGILLLLILHVPTKHPSLQATAALKPVVHASMVDVAQLEAQEKAIKMEADRKKRLAEQQRAREQAKLAAEKEKQRQEKLAQLKAEQQKKARELALAQKKKAEQAAREKKAQQAKLAAEQEALQKKLLQQQMEHEKQQLVEAQQMQRVVDQYRARILAVIASRWLIPEDVSPTIFCVFTIDVTPEGAVSHVQLSQSSGNAALDRAAEAAIYKSSPLPVPKEPSAFAKFSHFTLKMTPEDIQ